MIVVTFICAQTVNGISSNIRMVLSESTGKLQAFLNCLDESANKYWMHFEQTTCGLLLRNWIDPKPDFDFVGDKLGEAVKLSVWRVTSHPVVEYRMKCLRVNG